MSRIKSSGTKPEMFVRKLLHKEGFRYRLDSKINNIKPDIVLSKYNTCIFIHGCFWHSHDNCKYAVIPKSNIVFWKKKLKKNKERDLKNEKRLIEKNWKIVTVWECSIKKKKQSVIEEIKKFLNSDCKYKEI